MKVYVYQAALLCQPCAERVVMPLIRVQSPERVPAEPDDETNYDSDDWPKGPYPDGGGEADTPQHCDKCFRFLMNPLTPDGYEYVREALARYLERREGNVDVLRTWDHFYGFNVFRKPGGHS